MKGNAIRQSQMFAHVSAFGEKHAEWFAEMRAGRAALVSLRDAMRSLGDYARAQDAGRPAARTRAKSAARERLRMYVCVLNRTMRAMAIDAPEGTQRFRLPKSNGDAALLTAARTLLVEARHLEPAFATYGLSPMVVDEFQASIDAFDRASGEARALGQASMAATRAVDATLAQARGAVSQLDAIVSNLYGNDPTVMTAWRSARRVPRTRRARGSIAAALVPVGSCSAPSDRQVLSGDANALLYLRVIRVIFEVVHATARGGSICP